MLDSKEMILERTLLKIFFMRTDKLGLERAVELHREWNNAYFRKNYNEFLAAINEDYLMEKYLFSKNSEYCAFILDNT